MFRHGAKCAWTDLIPAMALYMACTCLRGYVIYSH